MTETTKDFESTSPQEMSGTDEAGVAELLEFYEKVEVIYIKASASISESDVAYTLDSTDAARVNAYLG